ncbi:MAG: beta-galactosidase [Lentisphaeria bacterium]|nr:beta-galactosidase [Lentisphaeria bacterium]
MNLGVQYYRAPFPDSKHWESDLRKMRDSGLNTVQLWVSWGWVEPAPGKFVYDDYDRLVELAAKNGLGVVLSTIAEIQPNWIHRVVPGSEMIGVSGNRIVSCARCEHHFGLTPGGCTDHPEVWARMKHFIRETGRRYAGLGHLRGWDIWNELRWNVHAGELVCFCPDTLRAFRAWLEERFGSLEGLNEAWKRRYCSWEDVMPGRIIDGVYTELMAFQHFLTCRADRHGALRYEAMREVDPVHTITAHGSQPSAMYSGDIDYQLYALDRGNDWSLADRLDGIGCSSFPQWGGIDDAGFGLRIDMVKSAARGKKVWLSELQGGRAAVGFNLYDVVRANQQQRWLWNGLGCGADTILFWCWRDEVFGRESNGFGIDGRDGFAEERLAGTRVTGELWEKHAELFDGYVPDTSEVGVFFSPQSYYLAWAQEGKGERIRDGLTGYGRAFTKRSIPLVYVEENHLEALDGLKVLFMPRVIVTDPAAEKALAEFVERGGTLVVESECGAFSSAGFYRGPEERFLTGMGVTEIGRRSLDGGEGVFRYNGREFRLGVEQWRTPAGGDEFCAERKFGKGRVIHFASYPGNAYLKQWNPEFEELLAAIVRDAGVVLPVEVLSPACGEKDFLYLKSGKSGGRSLLIVFFPSECARAEVTLADGLFPENRATELFSGRTAVVSAAENGRRRMMLEPGRFQIAVYADDPVTQ